MKKNILVVDDSATIRSLQAFILQSAGFKVETASNGIEALEKLYCGNFDLIVADINMPKMDGLKMIETLRKQDIYRDLPIIIVTSEEDKEDREKGLKAGANVYLVKPTDPKTLVMNVKMLLDGEF
ncbi:response regulator [Candidatus Aerophobetes bacterium]|uniref:Response regulator n=1 Tax=Aerophobetes bacterium TaxID=2030807 RepID=A0A662DKM1_UNCAE|nr:response regulator [Candidatus Aerophobetes bacterium]RLE14426.1 MAG: response regulator [Candidatus Aerophobetes bacterium]